MRHRRSSAVARSSLAFLVVFTAVGLAACDGSSDRDATREAGLDVVVDFNVGDGRLAVDAPLDARQLAVGPDGDVYLAAGYEVRRVDLRSGTITALRGTPLAECANGASPETSCPLGILAVAVDRAGNVYFAVADGRILRLPPDGGEPVFVAGAPADRCSISVPVEGPAAEVCFAGIQDMVFDPAGGLLIADGNGHVVRLDLTTDLVAPVAGNGSSPSEGCEDDVPATATCIGAPTGITLDAAGDLYVVSPGLPVRRVDHATGLITRVAGRYGCTFGDPRGDGGEELSACIPAATDVAVGRDGVIYVADELDRRIRRVDPRTGIITSFAGGDDGGAASTALAFDADGRLYALDYDLDFLARRLRRFDVASGSDRIVAGNGTFGFCGDGGPARDACLGFVLDVKTGPDDALYVADRAARRVRRIGADGRITTVAGNGGVPDFHTQTCPDGVAATETCLVDPARLAVDARGTLYVQQGLVGAGDRNRVRRVDRAGVITTVVGGCTVEADALAVPAAEACVGVLDLATAADGTLYLAEQTRVLRLDAAANRLVPVATAPADCDPGYGSARPECFRVRALAVDRAGNAYVADGVRVRRIAPDGAITIVAGNGETGWCGDGGLAVDACLFAGRVVPDDDGNLFVASAGVVRRVDAATGIITTVAGTSEGECAFNDGSMVPPDLGCATVHAIDARGRLVYPEESRYYFTRLVRLTLGSGQPVR